ncbi:hypothetical protein DFH28DRAFT_1121809 [Melampsora americana]|nr:hypothetical protein DFH28DRAFT_1137221 [Melampsora americana]KAH9820019.1 hypothetical protein DFH28DRAFT_1121809 [Melampsora americana]
MPYSTRSCSQPTAAPTAPARAQPARRNSRSSRKVSFESSILPSSSQPGRNQKHMVRSSTSNLNLTTRKRRSFSSNNADNPSDDEDDSPEFDSDPDIQLQLRPNQSSTSGQPTNNDIGFEDADLFQRLENQFQAFPQSSHQYTENHIHSQRLPRTSNQIQQEEDPTERQKVILPTIHDYKTELDKWPPHRIAVLERSQKTRGTAVPPNILKEAQAICKLYKHQKAMLALMGNISKFTLDKALGELGGRRKSGGYQIWKRYSKEIDQHPMPPKGGKGILAKRNRDLGKIWTALPEEQHIVFHPAVFYRLSGLAPPPQEDIDNEDEEEDLFSLNPTELAQAQVLYDKVVNKEKVAKEFAKAAAGVPHGPSLPDYNRQSLKCIERLHSQLENDSNNMSFAYYLLACSTYASSERSNAAPGWCREFTSHEEMALYVNKKSNFSTVFAARAQGLSVAEVVAQTIGGSVMLSSEKARKPDPGDKVKSDLAGLLRPIFSKLIGKDQGFPRCPNPESVLLETYNIKIIQLPGSSLPKDVLKLGFNGMNSRRSLWLSDVQNNLFRLQKATASSDVGNSETEGNDLINHTDAPVMMTQDDNDEIINDMMETVEEEEWIGVGDIEEEE